MRIEDLDARWHALSEEVMTGMTHRRARMLEDATLVSRATDWEATDTDRPVCPQCGTVLQARGRETRTLTTHYDQALQLERRYAMCSRCQAEIFPLDEELQLLAGQYTPTVYEGMTRLGMWMPFEHAVQEVGYFLHMARSGVKGLSTFTGRTPSGFSTFPTRASTWRRLVKPSSEKAPPRRRRGSHSNCINSSMRRAVVVGH